MKKIILMCLFLSVNLVYGQKLADKIADETCKCLNSKETEVRMDPEQEFLKCLFKAINKYQKKIEKEYGSDLNKAESDTLLQRFMQTVGLSLALNCEIFIDVIMDTQYGQNFSEQNSQDSVYVRRGNQYYDNKEYELALEEYKKVTTKHRNYLYYNKIGLCYYALEDNLNGVVNYYIALTYKPDSPEIYSNLALCLAGLQKYDEAINALDSAIFYKPEAADYYFQKGQIFYLKYKFDEADSLFQVAISMDSTKSLYYSEMAYINYYSGDTTSAISIIKKAISLDEGDADLYYGLATFLFSKKEYSMVIENLEKFNQLSPESSEGNYKLIACYLEMGNTTMAKEYFQKIPATDSNNYAYKRLYNKLELKTAQKEFELGNYEAALRYANATIEKDSVDGNYSFRAEIHSAKGNYQAAIDDYTKIIDWEPCGSCKYYKLRSQCYTKLKMTKEAENDLQIWNLLGCEKRSEIDYDY